MFHFPTWPGAIRRAPPSTPHPPWPATRRLATWFGGLWQALCEHAERPGRKVPYY